ncbi:MAG: molybdopterin converting factor subunit 1 [Roseiflexaceae bacterium]
MHITVRYFAGQRDITGQQSERIEIADGSTLATVWQHLENTYPTLAPFRGRVLYAQNARFVPAETILNDGDTVAFIPPVSGGTFRPFVVTSVPLEPAPLVAHVSAPNIGAIVTFAGTARDHFGDRVTARLEYEAYVEMAEQVLADIAAEAITRFGVVNVAIHHRIGILEIGETAVLVVVASAHRGPALEATGWIMDRIKEIAPIWKKEHWADGAQEWIGHEKDR